MAAIDFEELLNTWMTTVDIDDLKEVLSEDADHPALRRYRRTARRDAVAWLAEALGAEAFVAAAVEVGVLVELERSGWNPDSCSPSTNMAGKGRPRGTAPLYRLREET